MKKLIVLIVLGAAAVFGIGQFMLSEKSAAKFLASMDEALLSGEGQKACDRVHDDVEFSVNTSAGGQTSSESGGREQFCDYLKKASAALSLMKGQMEISVTRDNFKVVKDWKHPWTAHYTYTETTTMNVPSRGAAVTLDSESSMTLVMTLTGLKLRKASSEVTASGMGGG